MSTTIIVPELGESVIEATVGRWLKQEGDRVMVGEPVVELETEKVDLEVGAEKAGVLARIVRKQGENVHIGDALGVIEEAAEQPGQAAAQPRPVAVQGTPGGREAVPTNGKGEATQAASSSGAAKQPAIPVAPVPASRPPGGPATGPSPVSEVSRTSTEAFSTPSARRLAREQGVDLARVPSRAVSGRVTAKDVQTYLQQERTDAREQAEGLGLQPAVAPPPAPQTTGRIAEIAAAPSEELQLPATTAVRPKAALEEVRPEERVRMSRRRQTIARRLVEAQHAAAMLTTFNEVDMGAVMELRTRRKESFKQQHGVKLGIVSFFVKASIAALREFPRLNAELDGDEMVLKRYYDIGIAVGASGGLVVPVLRDADRMSFAEIEATIEAFARKAEDGTLTLEDLRGGTFTITNGGVFGSLLSTPILNPPQVGILGLHKIQERPVSLKGQVIVRPMMYVALSYDHRIVDGREAVQFLARIKELVEDPGTLLLEA